MLQGLEELISKFDSNIDIDVAPSSKSVLQLVRGEAGKQARRNDQKAGTH
ncbi:MAG: hypothetical protein V7L01_06815 [Nostoc sp.]